MKICLDAGHGGRDPGAVGTDPFELEEKLVNLSIAGFLEEKLEDSFHWVAMTRRRDVTVSLDKRAAAANQLEADIFVSLHANSSFSPNPQGFEVYHYPGSVDGRALAGRVAAALAAGFPDHINRGVKARNFKVLRETNMPAVLVEVEFLSHPGQLQFLANEDNRKALAEAIAAGIENFNASP